MGKYRFSLAVFALTAVVFFFAGYSAQTMKIASAQVPHPTPSGKGDGDPSGRYLYPKGATVVSAARSAELAKSLKALSGMTLAISYVATPPGTRPPNSTLIPTPKCSQPCVQFVLKNMQLENVYADGTRHGPRPVDAYVTISLK